MTTAADLTIVIPTRDRWPILKRTLDALSAQTVTGFEVVIAVDGEDQNLPDLGEARVAVSPPGGSGATRNAGVAEVRTRLTMLLDDDMVPVPEAIERHLEQHSRHPEEEEAVLGRVLWHPDLPPTRISRWLDWSSFMFDYEQLVAVDGADVGWGRFFSCNVSFKTALFRSIGGFDESFIHYYEDTDLGKRLSERGLRVRYEPRAVTQHLQAFDWNSVVNRFDRVAVGERLMVRKHSDFEPWFKPRMEEALRTRRPSSIWPVVVDSVPRHYKRMRRLAEHKAHLVYTSRLAPSYLDSWKRAGVLGELMDYLGEDYEPRRLIGPDHTFDRARRPASDRNTAGRSKDADIYGLALSELKGVHASCRALLAHHLRPGAAILDYGCGIGTDGLAFGQAGFRPSFASVAGPPAQFLRWRLAQRGRNSPVYDIDHGDIPSCFDAVFAFDVLELVDDPFALLDRLEQRASIVMVNLVEPRRGDTSVHRPLPIKALLDHAATVGILRYRRTVDSSHVVMYRSRVPGIQGRARSLLERRFGGSFTTA